MYGFIFTDSLGCPRDESRVEETWPYKIIDKYRNSMTWFTFLMRAADSRVIDSYITSTMRFINPDFVIIQVGIVDCARRALPNSLVKILGRIPILGDNIHKFALKHHYILSKIFNSRRVQLKDFKLHIQNIINFFNDNDKITNIILIEIAKAGIELRRMTYDIENDISRYNDILIEIGKSYKNVTVVSPYNKYAAEDYTLETDGHHLNDKGIKLVLDSLSNLLDKLLNDSYGLNNKKSVYK